MKKTYYTLLLPVALLCLGNIANAQPTSSPTAPLAAQAVTPGSNERDQATYEKHTKPIMNALMLDDADKADKVHDIMVAYFSDWKAWHAQNDAQLKELWVQYGKARNTRNQTNIDNAMSQIETVYATFKPRHEALIGQLSTVLAPAQIETVEDAITIKKVEITFRAYGEIFHGLTDEQKAFILKKLKAAREEAINAGSMVEISAFFKKYKDQIETYLTAQGYDVKQSYKDFGAEQKAEAAAKKTAAQPATPPAGSDTGTK